MLTNEIYNTFFCYIYYILLTVIRDPGFGQLGKHFNVPKNLYFGG